MFDQLPLLWPCVRILFVFPLVFPFPARVEHEALVSFAPAPNAHLRKPTTTRLFFYSHPSRASSTRSSSTIPARTHSYPPLPVFAIVHFVEGHVQVAMGAHHRREFAIRVAKFSTMLSTSQQIRMPCLRGAPYP